MFKKFFALALASSLINSVSAVPMSSAITLASGSIEPTESLTLPLDKLVPGIDYDITCKISNPNEEVVTIGLTNAYFYSENLLNGTNFYKQGDLQVGDNTLILKNVSRSENYSFAIVNADQTNVIDVSGCIAVAK